ncbi:endo alpha-1,4 polygalactosaminidase [Actinomadura scrupuli]|uniref:endo alpha-1,4 polygalactosaminidase n=1 Tax=Actinomadura scrupuli TaxID=559629 RepID=UPI003D954F3A
MDRTRQGTAYACATAAALLLLLLTAGTAVATPAGPARHQAIWHPALRSRWQYQLSGDPAYPATGGVNVGICRRPYQGGACVRPEVFDIDLYADAAVTGDNGTLNTAAVRAIHAGGARAICYVDAGGIEKGRPDYRRFVEWDDAHGHSLIGKPYPGFPDERYANINNDRGQRDFLLAAQGARVRACARAGFDGVEFDVVNAYEDGRAVTGWDISAATQLEYNRALAGLAHRHGLSVALKNDLSQIPQLVSSFDYAVNEQCFQYAECGNLALFISAGKPVFQVEYSRPPSRFCPQATATWHFNSIKKGGDARLTDQPYTPCR